MMSSSVLEPIIIESEIVKSPSVETSTGADPVNEVLAI